MKCKRFLPMWAVSVRQSVCHAAQLGIDRTTQPFIHPGSLNVYQLWLWRQRQIMTHVGGRKNGVIHWQSVSYLSASVMRFASWRGAVRKYLSICAAVTMAQSRRVSQTLWSLTTDVARQCRCVPTVRHATDRHTRHAPVQRVSTSRRNTARPQGGSIRSSTSANTRTCFTSPVTALNSAHSFIFSRIISPRCGLLCRGVSICR